MRMATIRPLMVGPSPTSLVAIPTPTGISWGLQDVSTSDAGRVNDANATMQKNRITTKVKLAISWKDPDEITTRDVLSAFGPEYVFVRYFEPRDAAFAIREFYTGDMSAPFRQFTAGGLVYETLSFNIIER